MSAALDASLLLLATILRQHGVDTLYTRDKDFRKYYLAENCEPLRYLISNLFAIVAIVRFDGGAFLAGLAFQEVRGQEQARLDGAEA